MFFIGVLLVAALFVRVRVPKPPAWATMKHATPDRSASQPQVKLETVDPAIILMTALHFLAREAQDLYSTFLREQHEFVPHAVSLITIILSVGVLIGGLSSGFLPERLERRWTIFGAALLALPVLPLWALPGNRRCLPWARS